MPKRDDAPAGAPCWVDLSTSDADASRAFYGELFGWESEDAGPDYGGYINFSKDGAKVAGAMAKQSPEQPETWGVYLAVDDADATVAAAEAHGGQVLAPVRDVMDLGRMAFLTDAGGAVVGLWQPKEHRGFGLLAEAGAPSWFELHTRDYAPTVAFYEQVFGWDTAVVSDSDEFRYTTLGEGENGLAGVMDASASLPEGMPAHWSVYFGVPDTDAALDRATGLGATVINGPADTPYGRLAALADPNGAMFKIVDDPAA